MNTIADLIHFKVKDIPCPMVWVEGDTFEMQLQDWTENKVHSASVTVPDFYIAKYPVTQALYEAIMEGMKDIEANPSRFKGRQRPVEQINWHQARAFIEALKKQTGMRFRLPSEAEWAFAAIGGKHSQHYEYCGSDDLKQVGWYRDNSGNETKPVGLLLPNELGLCDMSGNVWEWCEDDWHGSKEFKNKKRHEDGRAWVDGDTADSRGSYRVVRGGSYFYDPLLCRPSDRSNYHSGDSINFIGFRLVLSLQSVGSHNP
jgi:formylglycine-generating enzyme